MKRAGAKRTPIGMITFTRTATMFTPIRMTMITRIITITRTITTMRIVTITATTTAMSRAATGSITALAWPASMFPA